MKLIVLFLLLSIESMLISQDIEKRFVKTDSFNYEFNIGTDNFLNSRLTDSLFYYSFKAQKLSIIQGGAIGFLLNGNFLKYYSDGNIAESGALINGLKNGIWKTWFHDGKMKSKKNL